MAFHPFYWKLFSILAYKGGKSEQNKVCDGDWKHITLGVAIRHLNNLHPGALRSLIGVYALSIEWEAHSIIHMHLINPV